MVFNQLRGMMMKHTKCAYSKVVCAKCPLQDTCEILKKYLAKEK